MHQNPKKILHRPCEIAQQPGKMKRTSQAQYKNPKTKDCDGLCCDSFNFVVQGEGNNELWHLILKNVNN
jgi:hypothetical protein